MLIDSGNNVVVIELVSLRMKSQFQHVSLLLHRVMLHEFVLQIDGLQGELRTREQHSRVGRKALKESGGAASKSTGGVKRPEYSAIGDMSWAQAMRARTNSVATSCISFIRDLPSHKDIGESARDLDTRLSRFQQDCFKDWCEAMDIALRNGKLSLELGGKLMEFDADGNMVVRYNESMVLLLR
jgi:hypothetical protein